MKNKLIALMAVIPLIILFTLLAFLGTASVSVAIPVSGVRILSGAEDGVLTIDLAEYEYDEYLRVEVLPLGAADRGYDLELSSVDGSPQGDVAVEDDGLVVPGGTGMVRVTAVTHDGGYRASVIVNVISTKALGADVYAVGADGTEYAAEESSAEDADYELTLPLGSYVFETYAQPASVTVDAGYSASPYGEYGTEGGFTVHAVSGRAEAKLSGRYMLTASVSPAVSGSETVRVLVTVTGDGFTAEGSADEEVAVRLAAGTHRAVIYAESGSAVDISAPLPDGIESASADVLSEERGQYAVSVVFSEDVTAAGGSTALTLSSGGEIRRVTFVFAEEHAEIYGRFEDGDADVFVQKTESLLTYAAVSGLYGGDVGYRFELEGGAAEIASQDADNGTCTLRGLAPGEAMLSLFVTYGGREELADVRTVLVVEGYTHFVFTENASTWGIGGVYAVGGVGYADGAFTACAAALGFGRAYGTDIIRSVSDDIVFTVSDPSLAEVAAEDGGVYFTAKGTGRVTVTAEWKYTELFRDGISASLTLDAVADGVNVYDYEGLAAATEDGRPVVLQADVMLGENMLAEDGTLKPGADPSRFVKQIETTADWTYYANRGEEHPTVNYAIEFKSDVYGNGMAIDADYITQVTPAVSSSSAVFDGPLDFAAMPGVAAVKAQDNIVFLVRSDGVTIDNVVLRGCSSGSLYRDGEMMLNYLDTTGTVLEIMSDCRVINSRIMNGRTCVRVFGRYGVGTAVTEDNPVDAAAERMDVSVESCIISNAREFLVKTGTNRKVPGQYVRQGLSYDTEAMEPSLAADGVTYMPRDDSLVADETFRETFVLTGLTIKDSALYNSGLFCIGVESAFAGPMLDGGMLAPAGWRDLGGTSYAAVLKLVGDVRMYDWKSVSDVDSSTLIELSGGAAEAGLSFLSLDVGAMLSKVRAYGGDAYADMIDSDGTGDYVHGGIAFYGGGKNYSMLDLTEFTGAALGEYSVNLSVLAEGEENSLDSALYLQGTMLPLAAGTQDFRFFMYGADGEMNRAAQSALLSSGEAFSFIRPAERWTGAFS